MGELGASPPPGLGTHRGDAGDAGGVWEGFGCWGGCLEDMDGGNFSSLQHLVGLAQRCAGGGDAGGQLWA